MKIRPLQDWAVIKRLIAEEKTSGGIIIPDSSKEKPAQGVIMAIGRGKLVKEAGKKDKFVPTSLKPGEVIYFKDYKALDIEIDGHEITMVREEDVLGTIELQEDAQVKNTSPKTVRTSKPVSGKKTVAKKSSRSKQTVKKQVKKTAAKTAKKEKTKPVLKKIKTKKVLKKKVVKKKK